MNISKSKYIQPVKGSIEVVGDKSISSRALIIGSQTSGSFCVKNALKASGINKLTTALRMLGLQIRRIKNDLIIKGMGIGGLHNAEKIINFGNAATSARLMSGLLAGHNFTSFVDGFSKLRTRPMQRIIEPLGNMGAVFLSCNNKLPLAIKGSNQLSSIEYELKIASAQVKSAILLAGLNAEGTTTIFEPLPTRDHTEIMLTAMGAKLTTKSKTIYLEGKHKLNPIDFTIPGDPSSAAYLISLALLIPNSEITIQKISINKTRMGFYDTLKKMGADIKLYNHSNLNGEKIADMVVKYSKLQGITLQKDIVPTMIDEFPIFSIIASFAESETVMQGLSELKFKESNRFLTITNNLKKCGVNLSTFEDNIKIQGANQNHIKDANIEAEGDHRIAMSFLALNAVTGKKIRVDNIKCIDDSFPQFLEMLQNLGGKIN